MLRKTVKFFAILMATSVIAIGFNLVSKRAVSPFLKNKFENTVSKKEKFQLQIFNHDNIRFIHKNIQMLPNVKSSNLKDILNRGELVVCALAQDYNPFFQIKTKNKYIGEDIRFAIELGKVLGVKILYKMAYKTYDDVVDAVYNGEDDIGIAKLSYTPERARKVAYSEPYVVPMKMLILNRRATGGEKNNTLSELLDNPSAKIGVMKNTSYESFTKSLFPKAQISRESEWENGAIDKLKNGKVIAVTRDEFSVLPLINRYPHLLLSFMPLVLKGTNDPISAITNIEGHTLISYINNFLKNEYMILSVREILNVYKDYVK